MKELCEDGGNQCVSLSGVRRLAFNQFNKKIYDGGYQLVKVDQCFCGGRQFNQLSTFDRYNFPFGTKICSCCGLITLDPMLREGDLESFYNNIYWPLVMGSVEAVCQTYQEDFSDFKEFIKPHLHKDIKTVMEVGCGSGVRLELVKSLLNSDAVRFVGCDYSDEALQITNSKGLEGLKGGIKSLKSVGKADILILSHIFEHLPDLRNALKDISELIHPNTKIYVEVPGVVDLENKKEYGFDYQDYCVLAHMYNFSLATLTNVFREEGLELVKGNEYVRAIFSRNVKDPQPISDKPYDQIVEALRRAQEKAEKHNKSIVRRLKRAILAAKEAF